MLATYTGYWTTNNPPEWVNRAIKKHAHWALHTKTNHTILTNMNKWVKLYPYPNTWTFGTLIKLLSIEQFIHSNNSHYLWMDMDVHPTPKAYQTKIPLENLLNYCEHTETTRKEPYSTAKQQWSPNTPYKYKINTGFFTLDKPTAENLWNHINKEHSINTPQWWNKHLEKQKTTSPQTPWERGDDETIIEEWFNKRTPNPLPKQIPPQLHSVHDQDTPAFKHYHLNTKNNYPND